MLDMMLQMQRAGLRAMTLYQPAMSAFFDTARAIESTARFGAGLAAREVGEPNAEQVIAVGEEVLNVGTRVVPGKTTRVRRIVLESPVHQDVTLHTETVVLEHRKPLLSSGDDVLSEITIEMSDTNEVPVISKSVRLVEEVLLRKEVTSRVETIHDTIKRDKLEIEQPSQLPVVFNAAHAQDEMMKQEDKRRRATSQDRKPAMTMSQPENEPAEPKR
jgi:stress response protein YsnF